MAALLPILFTLPVLAQGTPATKNEPVQKRAAPADVPVEDAAVPAAPPAEHLVVPVDEPLEYTSTADELGGPAPARKLEKPRKASGYYEGEELSTVLSPFGPAGLVYVTLLVLLIGGVFAMMAAQKRQRLLAMIRQQHAALQTQGAPAAPEKQTVEQS